MNWEAVGALAEGVGALGVVLTIAYLAVQVRHNSRSVQAATYDALVGRFREWNSQFSQSSAEANFFHMSLESWDSIDDDDRRRAIHIWFDFLKMMENVHYQYRTGMMEEELWSGWEEFFRIYLPAPGLQWYWSKRRRLFAPEFQRWAEGLVANHSELPRVEQLAQEPSGPNH